MTTKLVSGSGSSRRGPVVVPPQPSPAAAPPRRRPRAFAKVRAVFSAFTVLVATAVLALFALPSRAAAPPEPELDELELGPLADNIEVDPDDMWHERPGPAPLWVSIDGSVVQTSSGKFTGSGFLMLGVPLDRIAARRAMSAAIADANAGSAPAKSQSASPAAEPPPLPKSFPRTAKPPQGHGAPPLPPPSTPPPSSSREAPESPPKLAPGSAPRSAPIVLTVTTDVARSAVDAALLRAHLVDPDARLNGMASRARNSAGLPEIRMRVLRTVAEGDALSPVAYDPTRTTATATGTTWLEARATWRLDRLVFANEEVALERVRSRLALAQRRVVDRVVGLLLTWQRALAAHGDPHATPDEQITTALAELQAAVELDLVTGGWFTRWRETGRLGVRAE